MFGLDSQSEKKICFTINSEAGISVFEIYTPANDCIDSSGEYKKGQQDANRLLTKSQISVREVAPFLGKAIQALLTGLLITEHYNS